jgi:hypothetical protein
MPDIFMSRAISLDRNRSATMSFHIGGDSFRSFTLHAVGEGDGCAVGSKVPHDLGADPS